MSVKELQKRLQSYGVQFSGSTKYDLMRLCEFADEVGLVVDPDGLIEDRDEVIRSKLTTPDGTLLNNPQLMTGSKDLHRLPPLSVFDLYNYLLGFSEYSHNSLREFHKMEAYGLFQDGYVQDLEVVTYDDSAAFTAVKCRVKPRTNENDPATKLPYYSGWIIFSSSVAKDSGPATSIYSAFCTCKGGFVTHVLLVYIIGFSSVNSPEFFSL